MDTGFERCIADRQRERIVTNEIPCKVPQFTNGVLTELFNLTERDNEMDMLLAFPAEDFRIASSSLTITMFSLSTSLRIRRTATNDSDWPCLWLGRHSSHSLRKSVANQSARDLLTFHLLDRALKCHATHDFFCNHTARRRLRTQKWLLARSYTIFLRRRYVLTHQEDPQIDHN